MDMQDSYSFQKSACIGIIVLSLVSQSAQSSMPTLHHDRHGRDLRGIRYSHVMVDQWLLMLVLSRTLLAHVPNPIVRNKRNALPGKNPNGSKLHILPLEVVMILFLHQVTMSSCRRRCQLSPLPPTSSCTLCRGLLLCVCRHLPHYFSHAHTPLLSSSGNNCRSVGGMIIQVEPPDIAAFIIPSLSRLIVAFLHCHHCQCNCHRRCH